MLNSNEKNSRTGSLSVNGSTSNQKVFSMNTVTATNIEIKNEETNAKPIEMNTFVQLEIENNNYACIPRVCRFCIKKLNIQSDFSSIVLAVKLDASKRSLRTVDIPLTKDVQNDSYYADLNLHYTVTYPHYIKKDTNNLYFYIQKRKKLKNRAILGFKTLAIGFVDLSGIMQKPFSSELPLYFASNQTSNVNSNLNNFNPIVFSNHNNTDNKSQKIIGSLKIQSLTSLPAESIDNMESIASNVFKNASETSNLNLMLKNEPENLDEDDDLTKMVNLSKNESMFRFENPTGKDDIERTIVESDTENENKKKDFGDKANQHNSKNFTGKILSFIKRFRNENSNNLEEDDEEEEEIANDTNLDDFDIEQVSDYTESETEPDAYSIISELKPKLQPFFTNNP
jgi:hypothetical protein